MDAPKAVPVTSTWVGVTYTYNGSLPKEEHYKIDDHIRLRVRGLKHRFKMVDIKASDVPKDWLNAQLLFVGLIEPGERNTMSKDEMSRRLREHVQSLSNKEQLPWPKKLCEIFTELKGLWREAHPGFRSVKETSDATRKRSLGKDAFRDRSSSHSKKSHTMNNDVDHGEGSSAIIKKASNGRPGREACSEPSGDETHRPKKQRKNNSNAAVLMSSTPRSTKPTSPVARVTGGEEAQHGAETSLEEKDHPGVAEVSRGEREIVVQPDPLESSALSLSTKWQSLLQEVKHFERKNYMLSIAGSYIIRCQQLEKMYPGLEGQFNLDIKYLEEDSIHSGVFQAHLDFGIFKGTAAFGVDGTYLAKYLWHATEESLAGHPGTYNEEIQRLSDEAHIADEEVNDNRMNQNEVSDGIYRTSPISINTCRPPALGFQFRVEDQYNLFVPNGTVFSDRGTINFADVRFLRFEGTIMLPMIDDAAISFEGFKACQQPRLCQTWKEWAFFPTSAVRFAKAWNRS